MFNFLKRNPDNFHERSILKKRLNDLFDIKEKPAFAKEMPEAFGTYVCYSLIPRITKTEEMIDFTALGDYFTLIYEKTIKNQINIYIVSPKSPDTLKIAFDTERALPPFKPFAAEFLPKKHWLQNDYVFSDTLGVVGALPPGTILVYAVSKEPAVINYLHKKKSSLESKAMQTKKVSKDLSIIKHRFESEPRVVRICVFSETEESLIKAIDVISSNLPPIRVKRKILKIEDDFYKYLLPPKVKKIMEIGIKPLLASEKALKNSILFPNPNVHPTLFTRVFSIPSSRDSRGSRSFKIGKLENGQDFYLSAEDFFKHVYVIGQTGSGKTNLLKVLVSKLQNQSVFVIDPHGSLANELAETLDNPIYLSPITSPFGLNPLKLPPLQDREQASLISTDVLMNLFTNVFNLPETAINVRYILQTVTKQLYRTHADPTLAAIYKIVMNIYNGADIGIADDTFKEHEKLLRNMPDQSFISTLGRLQSFAENSLLRRITSSTTIDLDKLIDENRPVLFSIPQSEIGITASTLLCSSLLLNIYYTVLIRHRQGKKTHVFVVIDEFQTLQSLPILASILSEARKFGLHLIIAHQYVEQLTEEVFQAAVNNSGVKFIFQLTGDIQKFKNIDPAFSEEIVRAISSLSTGKCLVKVVTTPEDAQKPPMVLKVDEYSEKKKRNLEDICTNKYEPQDVELSLEIINPIFKYIDPPFPPKQKIIYALYKSGGEEIAQQIHGHVAYLKDQAFNKIINHLAAEGYISVVRKGKGERILKMTQKFFEDFKKIAKSEKGEKLSKVALLWYLENKYYVAVTKNTPIPRPDFVAIPYLDPFSLNYNKAVEVEIEATTIDKNESHILDTLRKETVFQERHIWCMEEDYPTLIKYLKEANKPTKIFVIRGNKIEIINSAEVKELEQDIPTECQKELETLKHESKQQDVQQNRTEKPKISPRQILMLVDVKKIIELKNRGLFEQFIDESLKLEEPTREKVNEIVDRLLEPAYIRQLKEFCPPELLNDAIKLVEANGEQIIKSLREAANEGVLKEIIELFRDYTFRNPEKAEQNKADDTTASKELERDKEKIMSELTTFEHDNDTVSAVLAEASEEIEKRIKNLHNLKIALQNDQNKQSQLSTTKETPQLQKTPSTDKKQKKVKKLSNLVLDELGMFQQLTIMGRTVEVNKGQYTRLKRDLNLSTSVYLLSDDKKYEIHEAPPGVYTLVVVLKDKSTVNYQVRVV